MDDNFASIVAAVEEGRLIFDNLVKTIAYTLAHLWPEIFPVFLNLALGMPLGMTALQILSIDLITELGPAISLAYERKESDIMSRPPRNVKTDRLVSPNLLIYSYLVVGMVEAAGCMIAYMQVYISYGISVSQLFLSAEIFFRAGAPALCTAGGVCYSAAQQLAIMAEAAGAWYIVLILSQFFHIWMCKVRRLSIFQHGLRNRTTFVGVLVSLCFMVIFVYVPGVQTFFGAAANGYIPWVTGIVVGILLWAINEPRRWIARRYPDSKAAQRLLW
jgi:sodium/potassium-transporting ATPase subunit alpha